MPCSTVLAPLLTVWSITVGQMLDGWRLLKRLWFQIVLWAFSLKFGRSYQVLSLQRRCFNDVPYQKMSDMTGNTSNWKLFSHLNLSFGWLLVFFNIFMVRKYCGENGRWFHSPYFLPMLRHNECQVAAGGACDQPIGDRCGTMEQVDIVWWFKLVAMYIVAEYIVSD